MKTKVIRDSAGAIINIGDWDHQMEPIMGDDLAKPIYGDNKDRPVYAGILRRLVGYEQMVVGYEQKQVGEQPRNLLPNGAYEDEADIVESADGGLHPVENYRALRVTEYPSIGDQLDALFHAGAFPAAMAEQIAAVKAKYPKTTG